MSKQFSNQRRKTSYSPAQYQQIAGRVGNPGSSPICARDPGGKSAKGAIAGVDALRSRSSSSGGVAKILGLAALLLILAVGLGLFLWPSSGKSVPRTAETSQRQILMDAKPIPVPSSADMLRDHGTETSPELSTEGPDISPRPVDSSPETEATAGTWQEFFASGMRRAKARQWRDAANDFVAVTKLNPADHFHWYRQATLLAWLEDQQAYRFHCTEMLQRFADPSEPYIAERIAKACLLLPGAADMKRVVALADKAMAVEGHAYYRYFQMARALAHYRASEFQQAIDLAGKSAVADERFFNINVPAHLIVAMSQHRLSRAADAHKALGQARHTMNRDWFPKLESGQLDDGWHDWLICQILHREAERLIEGKKTP